MSRSQESFGKKEVRKRKEKKRKEKDERRARRKIEEKKGGFEDMIAYVDELGRLSSTPPDPGKKTNVIAEGIELTPSGRNVASERNFIRKGVIVFLNPSKSYGFIRDSETDQKIFVHRENFLDQVSVDDLVTFEMGTGRSGSCALKVSLFKG